MSEKQYIEIGELFAEKHGTSMGKMFGKQCLKTNNKAFAAFFMDDMVFKLGQEEIFQLREKYIGSENWDPSGKNRPMKDWLQVPSEFKHDWKMLAEQALNYVKAQQ